MIDKNIMSLDIEFEQPTEEIIQVGVVIGNLKTGKISLQYCEHINIGKPISEYISKLTGIKQTDIDNGTNLPKVYSDLFFLHKAHDCFRNCLTWGGGDSQALRNALDLDNEIFLFGRRWIDVKTVFISYMWSKGLNAQAGLGKALTRLGMQFEGKKHNAKDDALNTFLIYRELLKKFVSEEYTTENNDYQEETWENEGGITK